MASDKHEVLVKSHAYGYEKKKEKAKFRLLP